MMDAGYNALCLAVAATTIIYVYMKDVYEILEAQNEFTRELLDFMRRQLSLDGEDLQEKLERSKAEEQTLKTVEAEWIFVEDDMPADYPLLLLLTLEHEAVGRRTMAGMYCNGRWADEANIPFTPEWRIVAWSMLPKPVVGDYDAETD